MGAKGRRVRVLGKRMIINLNNKGGVRKFPAAKKSRTSQFRACMSNVTGGKRAYRDGAAAKCWAEAR